MSGDEQCAEMTAISSIAAALEPLDLNERERVLGWARDRFCTTVTNFIRREELEVLKTQMEQVKELARKLGVSEQAVYHTFSAMREREGVAPIEVRERIEVEERQLEAKVAKR